MNDTVLSVTIRHVGLSISGTLYISSNSGSEGSKWKLRVARLTTAFDGSCPSEEMMFRMASRISFAETTGLSPPPPST